MKERYLAYLSLFLTLIGLIIAIPGSVNTWQPIVEKYAIELQKIYYTIVDEEEDNLKEYLPIEDIPLPSLIYQSNLTPKSFDIISLKPLKYYQKNMTLAHFPHFAGFLFPLWVNF
ncbi:Uncharacterised protein [Candidatus Venteria ishoeyi]|uniref:Uncharacterized protein n=1 Tax=Candidatus Venteria ishoeyi TaxID=1899563 RepID=A0A1H6F3W4_9GAMM|nr:Uncharacterised protein [Candidatus Venteria ishoeyi]